MWNVEPYELAAVTQDGWGVVCFVAFGAALFVVVALLFVAALCDSRLDRPLDDEPDDICGLCGQPGADKIPHPYRWPGERLPDMPYVHSECEDEEATRAMRDLSPTERRRYLDSLFNS